MGYALVETGGLTRVGSLRRAAPGDRAPDPGRGADAPRRRADRGLLVARRRSPPPVKWGASARRSRSLVVALPRARRRSARSARPPASAREPSGGRVNLGASAIVLRPRTLGRDPRPRVPPLRLASRFGLYARLAAVAAPARASRAASRSATRSAWSLGSRCGASRSRLGTRRAGRLHGRRGPAPLLGGARRAAGAPALRPAPGLVPGACSSSAACLLARPRAPFLLGLPFAWPRLVFAHEASLLEGAGPVDAIRRSDRFVAGRGASGLRASSWRCSSRRRAFVVTAELLGQGLVDGGAPARRALRRALLGRRHRPTRSRASSSRSPTWRRRASSQYIDARTRSDGWDIQLRFMAIAAREETRRVAA